MNDINLSHSAITALYERFLDILERKDFEQFQEVVTSDFRYTENGHEMTLKQLIEREQQAQKGQPKSTVNSQIRDIKIENDTAFLTVEGDFTTEIEMNGNLHTYAGNVVQRIAAVQQAGRWLFQSSEVTATQMTLDGKPVGPAALDAMHRVE
ncbi:MAG: nuclear transport factor 2 family protein [Cyanobacteria bacterium P01_D01_bin.115]